VEARNIDKSSIASDFFKALAVTMVFLGDRRAGECGGTKPNVILNSKIWRRLANQQQGRVLVRRLAFVRA
jgi:hypothetical protein